MRLSLRQQRDRETETGLTALMALEDDVLDGQQAALPGGHHFKDDLRRKEKAHNHSDKWTHSQNVTHTGTEDSRRGRGEDLNNTHHGDEESAIHAGH